MLIPSPDEIRQIAAIQNAPVRNLRITQCYHELAAVLIGRTGPVANWCTFATWASKQAGQSIRREDLFRTVEARLNLSQLPEVRALWQIAGAMGIDTLLQQKILDVVHNTWLNSVIERTSEAVARGNKKVFEEIGWAFARFIATCFRDKAYNQDSLDIFSLTLRERNPPDGQQYLKQAFTNYYRAFFEPDAQLRTELQLLGNLQIGFHEQTRLQPEIAESLNAALTMDKPAIGKAIIDTLFPPDSWMARIRLTYLNLTGKTSRLETGITQFLDRIQSLVREILTAHLMTLTLPPDLRLALGKDLTRAYPDTLHQLSCPDLLTMLKEVDPTPDSLNQSGAIDWADLKDRMHFITELFRCYHLDATLYGAPFSAQQVTEMKAGKLPAGRL